MLDLSLTPELVRFVVSHVFSVLFPELAGDLELVMKFADLVWDRLSRVGTPSVDALVDAICQVLEEAATGQVEFSGVDKLRHALLSYFEKTGVAAIPRGEIAHLVRRALTYLANQAESAREGTSRLVAVGWNII